MESSRLYPQIININEIERILIDFTKCFNIGRFRKLIG